MSAETVNTSSENEGFFTKAVTSVVDLFISFFTWSVNKFGDVKGRILAWGLPGVILLWVVGTVFRMLFKKYAGDPAKKKVNKFSREQFGTSMFNRKPPLTWIDIIEVTTKYGFSVPDDSKTKDGHEVIMWDMYFGFPCRYVYFCDDAVRTETGFFAPPTQ